jgi:hypothetical protein
LRSRDPLAERVELGKPQFLLCGLQGMVPALLPRRALTRAPLAAPPGRVLR